MANETMKLLWGKNSKIPSSAVDGKAYFAVIDTGYTDSAAPANEAFIYLDKDGNRYNVIAKRAIFDSLGYKIVDKYFSFARNSGSNTIQLFTPSQNPNADTPLGSATIITAIDLSNSSITANEYKIKTIINGFEDKTTNTNSTLSLGMATGTLAGLVSAGEQVFGGQKTFSGKVIVNSDLDVNGAIITIDGTTSIALAAPTITNTAATSLTITAPTTNITATNALNITAPTAINGNTSITGTLGVTGVTSITNTTDATSSAGALKISGGALISKKLYVAGVATFANTTDGSSSGGAVVVSGGAKIAKSVYIGNNLTVAQAISNSRSATFNGSTVNNDYSTTVNGYFYGKNNATLSRSVVLNDDETTDTDTYTTTVKGKATFNKEATFSNGVIITGGLNVTGDGIFSSDLYARGGEVVIGAAGDCATLSYNATTDTLTISFP